MAPGEQVKIITEINTYLSDLLAEALFAECMPALQIPDTFLADAVRQAEEILK